MKFFRRFVYRKILGPFPFLQKSASTISREGFAVFYYKVKRRLKPYLWRFIYVHHAPITDSSETVPSKTYIRLSDLHMKADKDVIRKKIRAIIEEIEKNEVNEK
jgi:hypothetical protein